jgi:protocatechuate 3,4-dioxygenase beta subunit
MKLTKTSDQARHVLIIMAAVLLSTLLAPGYAGQTSSVSAAPATQSAGECSGTITPALTEGPYYKAGSPERSSLLEPGISGTKLTITGYVFDKNCRPIAHAWLDFWQADAAGSYDNAGYKLRGHLYTDSSGRYQVETVVPGEYPGRTVHIHVKAQAPNGPILTTQLFLPDVARNNSDSIYNQALLMKVQDVAGGKAATYSFVLNVTTTQTAQPTATVTVPVGSSYTFTQTGFTVSGDFWTAWQGGRSFADSLYLNGLPITTARDEVSPTDGKTYKTQWFERARFEAHPLNKPPYNVLLGLLGVTSVQARQSEAAFKAVANPGGGLQWFPETRHTLGDSSEGGKAIAAFWTRAGGIPQFGFPLSQPFMEVSKDDGKGYMVQYFERQRLEYHPENKGTGFEILLGRLGSEQVKK